MVPHFLLTRNIFRSDLVQACSSPDDVTFPTNVVVGAAAPSTAQLRHDRSGRGRGLQNTSYRSRGTTRLNTRGHQDQGQRHDLRGRGAGGSAGGTADRLVSFSARVRQRSRSASAARTKAARSSSRASIWAIVRRAASRSSASVDRFAPVRPTGLSRSGLGRFMVQRSKAVRSMRH